VRRRHHRAAERLDDEWKVPEVFADAFMMASMLILKKNSVKTLNWFDLGRSRGSWKQNASTQNQINQITPNNRSLNFARDNVLHRAA